LSYSGLAAGSLTLEITESVLMEDAEMTMTRLQDLKRLGVLLAIDDFGTGYSSLGYLRRFPIDLIKVDRSFVSELGGGRMEDALVRAIVRLGHSLNIPTLAEGIESPEQVRELRALGCPLGQGYLFSRPADADTIAALLARPSFIEQVARSSATVA
jgi:EAL domain-containing protein (putative c-di-GMP-specific phosphodiesterase class I)